MDPVNPRFVRGLRQRSKIIGSSASLLLLPKVLLLSVATSIGWFVALAEGLAINLLLLVNLLVSILLSPNRVVDNDILDRDLTKIVATAPARAVSSLLQNSLLLPRVTAAMALFPCKRVTVWVTTCVSW